MPLRYKVGDVVLLKVKVMNTDPSDQRLAYETNNGFWFTESDIVALATESIPATDEPAFKPLKVAEFVRTKNGSVGQIVKFESNTVKILFANSEMRWYMEREVMPATLPGDWPF